MKLMSVYQKSIEERGQSLADMNPGSTEFALTVKDALHAVGILDIDGSTIAILGGDIMTENTNGRLDYAMYVWEDGQKYHVLNWCVSSKSNYESDADYARRSRTVARNAISAANEVAERLGKKCYVVLVDNN